MAQLYLHKIYNNLSNNEDEIEVKSMELLTGLMTNSLVIDPIIVEKLLKDYKIFFSTIQSVEANQIELNVANEIYGNIVKINDRLDPDNLLTTGLSHKYRYLLPFISWTLHTSNLAIILNKLKELNEQISQAKELKKVEEKKLIVINDIIKDKSSEDFDKLSDYLNSNTYDHLHSIQSMNLKKTEELIYSSDTLYNEESISFNNLIKNDFIEIDKLYFENPINNKKLQNISEFNVENEIKIKKVACCGIFRIYKRNY